jgi:hypothetical protein
MSVERDGCLTMKSGWRAEQGKKGWFMELGVARDGMGVVVSVVVVVVVVDGLDGELRQRDHTNWRQQERHWQR